MLSERREGREGGMEEGKKEGREEERKEGKERGREGGNKHSEISHVMMAITYIKKKRKGRNKTPQPSSQIPK
jgi:flagellar biosynthesis/type III secretory pathway protein FliH